MGKNTKELAVVAMVMLVIAMAFGYAGKDDYAEELAKQERYCENVASGAWGNFTPETECE